MTIKCRNCGAAIADGVTICPYCDSKITFESKANNSETAPQDISGISFELTLDGKDSAVVVVNDVQTIRKYAERLGEGEVLNLEASSPINGIKWLSSLKDGNIAVSFCKNNITYDMDDNYNFEEFLSILVDFYEGRFNPSMDDYSGDSESDDEKPPAEELRAENLFEINSGAFSEGQRKIINNMYALINSTDKKSKYISAVNALATNATHATHSVNGALLKKAYDLISNRVDADEIPIYWEDSAVFKTGKTGTMYTSKRLVCVKKKEILELSLKDIKSICFQKDYVYKVFLNGSNDFSIFVDGTDKARLGAGALLAYICSMARDLNGVGYKIQITCEK